MSREVVDQSQSQGLEPPKGRRGSSETKGRAVVGLVALGFAIALVVQNSQPIAIRLWFVNVHIHLVWLLLVSALCGAIAAIVIRRTIRQRLQSRLHTRSRRELQR